MSRYETNNKMADVARLLGVELDEKFMVLCDIPIARVIFKLTEDGLKNARKDEPNDENYSDVLSDILTGRLCVNYISWEPKKGDYFYTPDLTNISPDSRFLKLTWEGSEKDSHMLENGLVFKTKAAAVYVAERLLDETRGAKNGIHFWRVEDYR